MVVWVHGCMVLPGCGRPTVVMGVGLGEGLVCRSGCGVVGLGRGPRWSWV